MQAFEGEKKERKKDRESKRFREKEKYSERKREIIIYYRDPGQMWMLLSLSVIYSISMNLAQPLCIWQPTKNVNVIHPLAHDSI